MSLHNARSAFSLNHKRSDGSRRHHNGVTLSEHRWNFAELIALPN